MSPTEPLPAKRQIMWRVQRCSKDCKPAAKASLNLPFFVIGVPAFVSFLFLVTAFQRKAENFAYMRYIPILAPILTSILQLHVATGIGSDNPLGPGLVDRGYLGLKDFHGSVMVGNIVDTGRSAALSIIGNVSEREAWNPAQQVPLRRNELLSVTEMAWIVEADYPRN